MKKFLIILTVSAFIVGCSKSETPMELVESRFASARYEQAIIACDVVLKESSDDTELHRARIVKGQSYMAMAARSRDSEMQTDADRLIRLAVNEFSKALELNENDYDAYYYRSDAHELLGNESASLKDAQTAREKDPSYRIAYTNQLRRKPIDLREIDRTLAKVIGTDEATKADSANPRDLTGESFEDHDSTEEEQTLSSLTRPAYQREKEEQSGDASTRLTNQKLEEASANRVSSNQKWRADEKSSDGNDDSSTASDENDGDRKKIPESMGDAPNGPTITKPNMMAPPATWYPQVRQPMPVQPSPRPQPATGFVNHGSRAHNSFPNYPTTGYTAPSPRPNRPAVAPPAGSQTKTSFGLGEVVTQTLPTGSMQFTGAMPFQHRPKLGGTSDKQAYLTPARPLTNNKVPAYTPPQLVKPFEPTTLRQRPPVYVP